jgi:hypothetical protein
VYLEFILQSTLGLEGFDDISTEHYP